MFRAGHLPDRGPVSVVYDGVQIGLKIKRQDLDEHRAKVNIQKADQPMERCYFLRVVSISIFIKTKAENLFTCLRPICTSQGYYSLGKCKLKQAVVPYTHQNGQN